LKNNDIDFADMMGGDSSKKKADMLKMMETKKKAMH
jgi:hypothetical protein